MTRTNYRHVRNSRKGERAKGLKTLTDLKPGQVRCSVCSRGVTKTTGGGLRKHVDLDGAPCPNRSLPLTGTIVAPPVHIPPTPRPPSREPDAAGVRPASRLDAGSSCRECGKWLPGERSLCGRCAVAAEEGRRRS